MPLNYFSASDFLAFGTTPTITVPTSATMAGHHVPQNAFVVSIAVVNSPVNPATHAFEYVPITIPISVGLGIGRLTAPQFRPGFAPDNAVVGKALSPLEGHDVNPEFTIKFRFRQPRDEHFR